MERYEPYTIYTNLIKMLDYRGIKLRGEALTEDLAAQKLNHYEFITIVGDRGADPRGAAECYIILIAPRSKYCNKSQDFRKLLRGLPKKTEGIEVMFVSEYALTTFVIKQLDDFKMKNPKIYVENYSYEKFVIEMPRHVLVPKHEIADDDEVNIEMCKRHYTVKEKFPKISVSDTMAIWIGLKIGMVAKIYRLSELAGEAIVYRYCIK